MPPAYRWPYIRIVAGFSDADVAVRPAATVILARDSAGGVEVLMVRRNRSATFMGGAHVFPGGALDTVDDSELARAAVTWSGTPEEFAWRAAALRELFEEAGIVVGSAIVAPGAVGGDVYRAAARSGGNLDADALEYVSNWVTPIGPPRRFDTRFYVAAASGEAVADDREVFDAIWVRPAEALAAASDGDWLLEFPTRVHLETFSTDRTAAAVVARAAAMPVERVEPRVVRQEDGSIRFLLPGDGGYEEAAS